MPFELETAIPVREREDGLLEKDTFDVSTAVPVENPRGTTISAPKEKLPYTPPLTDEQKAQAVVELTYREKGEQVPLGLKADWILTSPTAKMISANILGGILTRGIIPAYNALKGVANASSPNSDVGKMVFESAYKGLAENQKVDNLGGAAAKAYPDAPWQITGAMGALAEVLMFMPRVVQGGVELLSKDKQFVIALNTARKSPKWGDLVAKVAEKSKQPIEVVDQALYRKLWEIRGEANYFKVLNFNLTKATGVNLLSEAGAIPISKAKVGQSVNFTNPKGLVLSGTIKEITGQRAIINLEGREVVATLGQLSLPEVKPTEGKVVYIGKQEGKPQGKYIYGAENKEYASNFGEQISEQTITPKNTFDLTPLKETSISFDKLSKVLEDKGISVDKSIVGDDDVYKPAWQWIRKYPEIADKIKAAGFDSIKQLETFTGRGRKELTYQVLDKSILSTPTEKKPPVEPPKTAVSGEPEDIRKNISVAELLSPKEEAKIAQANEDFLIKTYEKDISKLEEQIKVEQFNTEAEKVKAQYKLQDLKQKYADAKEAQKQKKALRDEVKDLVDSIEASPKENVAIEYQEAIENIKAKFDLKNRQEATIAKREGMKAFVARMQQEGRAIDIPEEKLAMLEKVNLKEMTLDQLKEVSKTIKDLEKLGKTKLKAREAVYEGKKEKIKTALLKEATPIKSKELPKKPIGEQNKAWVEKAIGLQNYAQKTKVGLTPIDGLAEVTGMQEMKKVLDADFSDYLTHNDEAIKEWYDLTKDFTTKEMERIGVYAASKQDGGIERLANSGITEEEINAIELTPEEEKAYRFVVSTFNKEFPAVKQYMKEVYNADVGAQENYVSFMSDYDQMSDLEIYERFGQTPEQIANRKTKTVEQGFTKARAGVSKIKLETNIDKIFRRHLDDVAYMLNMGKNIKMYFEIVNSPEMLEKLGDVGTLAWLQWLDLMARKGGTEGAKRIAALDLLRRNIGAGVLSFRLSSALVQFSSFADTIATIGSEWATKGATSIATSKEWRSFILENFPEVKKAIGDDIAFREFGEGFLANMTRIGTKPLQILDGIMRSVAASGAYQKLLAEAGFALDLNNPNADIISEATKLMRQSQGSSFFKDQPLAITAGYGLADNRSLNKTILTFQSFMLNRWDNINRQIWRLGIKEKDYKKAIASTLWLMIFAGAVEEGIRRGSRKILSIVSGAKKKEGSFAKNAVLQMVQNVPLLGQIASSLAYSSNPVPVLNAVNDLVESVSYAAKSKKPKTKIKNLLAAVFAVGSLFGIAGSSQASQIVRQALTEKKKKKIRD